MFAKTWGLIKATSGFLDDEALSRAAAIAYFTIFSIAPLLLLLIAIAGLVFGREAAQAAVMGQFSGLMGKGSSEALQSMLQSAGSQNQKDGTIATIIGVVTLLITAGGAFGEIQSSLNKIWKAEPKAGLSRLVARPHRQHGLVLTLGFLMLVSLVISAGLAAFGHWVEAIFSDAKVLMSVANFVITLVLLSAVFAAIYKFLPDKQIAWRDVVVGAVATALLFTIGKSAIGLYIGRANIAESYGIAGSLIVIMVWIYYSTLICLLGAEFTRAYSQRHGSDAEQPMAEVARQASAGSRPEPLPEPRPALTLSPDLLEREAALTRSEIKQIWQLIRKRVPNPPTLRAPTGHDAAVRPSWFQIAVAALAVLSLPTMRRSYRSESPHLLEPTVPSDRLAPTLPRESMLPRHRHVPAQ